MRRTAFGPDNPAVKLPTVTRTIFKVALPHTSAFDAPALIYTSDRLNRATIPVTKEVLAGMRGSLKNFFHATLRDGQWEIDWRAPAPWQEW